VNGKINYQLKEKMYTEQEQCSIDPKGLKTIKGKICQS